jgi:ABC-type microcin C transport system permease subunit YejE
MNCDWKIENFGSKMVHNQDLSEETLLESINENVFVIHPLGKLKEKLISRLCNIHQRLNNEC